MEIGREHGTSKGCHVIRKAGKEAELTHCITTPRLISADHTAVPDSFRGTGAGLAPVMRMVEDARAEGVKIVPPCPFGNATRKRHPEWADVFI